MEDQTFGQGIMGVHKYDKATGIFSVIPTDIIGLEEGFYPFTFAKGLYTNFNPSITINKWGHMSYEDMSKLVGEDLMGSGIAGLLTKKMWGFQRTKSLF